MRQLLCFLLAAATSSAILAQGRGPGAIEYKTVPGALASLKAKKGTTVSVRDGYTVIEDKAADAVWSFVPPGHPAYPAVVRRSAVLKDGKAGVALATLCRSGKRACDQLVADFEQRDPQVAGEVRAKAYDARGVPLSEVEVERLGEDVYRLTLTSFTSKTLTAGQQELQARAQQLCGAKSVDFGKYEFKLVESFRDSGKDRGHFLLKQELACGGADMAAPASKP